MSTANGTVRYAYSEWADVDTSVRVLKIQNVSAGIVQSVRFDFVDIAGGAADITYYLHDHRSDNAHGAVAAESSYRLSMSDTGTFEVHNTDKGVLLVAVAGIPAVGFNQPIDPTDAIMSLPDDDVSSHFGEVHAALDAGTATCRVVIGIIAGGR